MYDRLIYAFTIFMMTIGPIKTIPAFAMISADLDKPATRSLALRGVFFSTLIVFATAFIFSGTMKSWQVSYEAMQIACGILLFLQARSEIAAGIGNSLMAPTRPQPVLRSFDDEVKDRALSPLAVPTIVTPFGIVAILLFVDASKSDASLRTGLYVLMAFMMLLNFAGMWFAKPIVKLVRLSTFRLVGWMFSVLLAGLAIQLILRALQMLKVLQPQ